jgi:hypothetical protein
MPPATTGTYRILQVDDERLLLADRDDEYEPVAATPAPDLDATLDPGNVIEAEIAFGADATRLLSAAVRRETVFEFVPEASVVFEAARETWDRTKAAGEGMGSRVTRDTDGVVNGVLYVFADTRAGDRIEEFRTGRRPLDPLLERVAESEGTGPREVFVVSPDDPYVVVTIALEPDGLFARTMRETYDLPGAGNLDLDDHASPGGAVPDLPDGLGDDLPTGESNDATDSASGDLATDDLGGVSALGHDAGTGGSDGESETDE